jgi:two-component system chemotaxis response regulator CheB
MTINVLIAEDSSFQRKLISDMISSHQDIEVIAIARDGREAIEMVEQYDPDVMLLDLLMPKMDGMTAFKHIMEDHPIPTIIFSVLDPRTMDASIKALILGAFDYVIKPGGVWKDELPKFKDELISKVCLAYKSKKRKKYKTPKLTVSTANKVRARKTEPRKNIRTKRLQGIDLKTTPINLKRIDFNIIGMGASVGGPKTLKAILKGIPKDFPSPILIVQHLNAYFMNQFAKTLNDLCKIDVKVGENDERVRPGVVYFSPGDKHMEIVVKNNKTYIRTFEGPPVNFCIPSVDVLFYSLARIYKDHAMGIILTGLGNDGAAGLGLIRDMRGRTIAESQETSIVYGMPKVAAQRGAAQIIVPNYQVEGHMIKFAKHFKTINNT